MDETEKYLFDINGYIVVRNALSAEDLALANEAVDHFAGEILEGHEPSLTEGSKALEGSRLAVTSMALWPGRIHMELLFAPC